MRETEAQKRERHHQEDLQRLREFRPIDDTFMRGMFKDNIPLAELAKKKFVNIVQHPCKLNSRLNAHKIQDCRNFFTHGLGFKFTTIRS